VIYAVVDWNRSDVERVYSFEAPNVVAILKWIRSSLMMRIDAALRAEVMLGRLRVELPTILIMAYSL
jgi:hypothetical protein